MSHEDYINHCTRAIALSLEESNHPRKPEVIAIDDDDDNGDNEEARYQADLRRALEASKAESQSSQPPLSPSVPSAKVEESKPGPSSFLSERAKLEKERLERQKRLRREVGLDDEKAEKYNAESGEDSDISMDGPPTKRQHLSTSSQEKSIPSILTGGPGPSEAEIFWDGELRQTATRFAEPRKDNKPTFRLTQVLGNVSHHLALSGQHAHI